MKATAFRIAGVLLTAFAFAGVTARADVLLSEIMYHPVEEPAFDANGNPVLDLSDDVHEFVEIKNTGAAAVSLAGWKLSGGIDFTFPAGASIAAGQWLVIAKNPSRIVTVYGLSAAIVLGPWSGKLGNSGDNVQLKNAGDTVVDAVTYSSASPWAIGADALGADDEWTGLNSATYQYKGRSLERVSFSAPADDPANWLASPLTGPSPGAANAVSLATPKPVVLARSALQNSTNSIIIRAAQAVRVDATFSASGAGVSNVSVEYFIDDINATSETHFNVAMTAVGGQPGKFTAQLPGQADRSIVRWRIKADRGSGVEAVSPRADDPFAYHAYFVTPVRSSPYPGYDCFISTASLTTLNNNISQGPRRITLPDPPGTPRASWNATEPAVIAIDGIVYDARMRYHGSRYRRSASRQSYKWQFPRYAPFGGHAGVFETDKGEEHRLGSLLYDQADLPIWRCRYVDLYLNSDAKLTRLEQEELDDFIVGRWAGEQAAKRPGTPVEDVGETFKSEGIVPYETAGGFNASTYNGSGEGPYWIGNGALAPAKPPWSVRDRYVWTFSMQMHSWKGARDFEPMLTGMWAARADAPLTPNPNLTQLRAWLGANFDVDATLTYIAIRNWSAPADDATQNHFVWRRGNGRWGMLPWDLDVEFGATGQSIYWDEQSSPQPDTLRGPHWIKDSFLKAYRTEYKQKLFILNNTMLSPANLTAIGASGLVGFANARQGSVNAELGLGAWYRPNTPVNTAPANGASVLPNATLQSSAYSHSAPAPPAHASTTWFIRAAGGTYAAPIVRVTSATDLTSLAIPFADLIFGQTYFWKCIHTDAQGHPSGESSETSFVFGTATGGPTGVIRLNEILANGSSAADFIELLNTGASSVELSGWKLTDDPAVPGKYTFPQGTTIAAGAYRVLTLGSTAAFHLDKDGQTVLLQDATGALADNITFGPQARDLSIGRNATGWELQAPTPGAANASVTLGAASALKVNEWLASNPGGADWFEIFNTGALPVPLANLWLSNDPATPQIAHVPALSFIAPLGFVRFIADEHPEDGAAHVNFKLSAGGDSIVITDTNGTTTINSVTFGGQTSGVSQGRLPDGSATIASFPGAASPEAPNHLALPEIIFNEVVPDIELRNVSAASVDVSGWFLSDDAALPQKYTLPAGSIISAGGHLAVAAAALPFQLNTIHGGSLFLSHGFAQATEDYGATEGRSIGKVTTSTGTDFVRLSSATFGAANSAPQIGPLVISEIQYHPSIPGADSAYEFVEVRNASAAPVDASGWGLAGEVGFTFPNGTTLAAGARVVVVADVAVFNAAYDVPGGTQVFGPWAGSLGNGGAKLELILPGAIVSTPGPDFGYVPQILAEKIVYRDVAPWPVSADGAGTALQRVSDSAYANDVVNWTAAPPSPGAASSSNLPPTISISSPANGASIGVGQPVPIFASASDADGSVKSVEFFADAVSLGIDTSAPFSISWSGAAPGAHTLTARARDNRLATTDSAPVSITITNLPPTATLTAPAGGSQYTYPATVNLAAIASDPDGTVAKVEFYDGATKIGEDTTAPYTLAWQPGAGGFHTLTARAVDAYGAIGNSPGVIVSVTRLSTLAYSVPAATVGGQNYPDGLGMDFDVIAPIVVTKLGVFDSGGNGINNSVTVQLYRTTPSVQLLTSMAFGGSGSGSLAAGTACRVKPLTTPLVLQPGSYSIVSYGHNAIDLNGNAGVQTRTWSIDDGGGLVSFTGGGRYGGAPGTLPPNFDGGPADRYAAGTFDYQSIDADGDGLPYDWEIANGFNTSIADGAADADADGASNLAEYLAGTNPRSAASAFRITSIANIAGGAVRLTFTARANRAYIVQRSAAFGTWADIGTVAAPTSDQVVTFDDTPTGPQQFYRLKASGP